MKIYWCRPPASTVSTEVVVGEVAELIGKPRSGRAMLVVDQGFAKHHPNAVIGFQRLFEETFVHEVSGGEDTKELSAIASMWDALSRESVDRSGTLIALGGGAVLDAASFAAATWHRGIDVWLAPTTLTAQVDAALGGKAAINHHHIKNQIGVFRQPNRLLLDPAWVATVSDAEFRSGLGEVVKTALLAGGELYAFLKQHAASILRRDVASLREVISGCLAHKARIVEADPLDQGVRNSLNAGHSLGHVLESISRRRGSGMTHGEAVALGLKLESAFLPGYDQVSVAELLELFGLARSVPFEVDPAEACALLMKDKKRIGQAVRLPIIEAPGSVSFHAILPEDLARAFLIRM